MHFKSPSLGSNSSLMVKVYNNSIAPKPSATTNTTNTSFRGPSTVHSPKASLASSPKASFRECISGKKDKKKLVFADIFPSTTKTSQTPSILEESPVKIFPNDSFSTTSGTLSPTTPHLGSYRMYITGRSKIGERPGLKILASDNNKNSVNSVPRQVMSPKDSELNRETGRVEMIKYKEMQVRKVKEQAAKELQKKELVAQIYERLVEMCKKNNNSDFKNNSYSYNNNNNSILKDGNRTQSELDIIVENENQVGGSVNRIKSPTTTNRNRKQFAINNSSLYNILTHKSMHTPTCKQSFFERIDARLNLEKDDSTPNNRDEAGRRSITLFKQNVIKVKNDGQSPKSPQYRVKTVLPGSRMKKVDKKVQEKSGARSEPPNESTFHSFGKGKRFIRLGESATMYTGEGSEDQNLLSVQTTTLNSKLIKENSGNHSFSTLVDRLDNVFSKYHNENIQLIAKIQELDEKIRAIEATKQRRAEHT